MAYNNKEWNNSMKLKNKQRKLLIDILIIITILAAFFLAYVGLRLFLATDNPFIVIASGSMSPALEVGDVIIVQGVPPTSIQIGDIIVFDSPQKTQTIHRVTQIQTQSNGTILFKTKGDANPGEDAYLTPEQNVHGRVSYRIPWLGWLALIPMIPMTIAIIIIIIVLIWPEKRRKTKKWKFLRPRKNSRNPGKTNTPHYRRKRTHLLHNRQQHKIPTQNKNLNQINNG
jgi:signal peptidase